MNKKDIAVVIPIYLPSLSNSERISLEQCLKLLSSYSIVVIKPESLDLDDIINFYGLTHIEAFPDKHFVSLRAYNKLVLSEEFYRSFQHYTYMLIYQLDAYVFKDELLNWANKGYDYIGAPWLPWKKRHLSVIGRYRLYCQRLFCRLFDEKTFKTDKYYAYQVGNGGFSLRRISKMLEITTHYKTKISKLLDDDAPFYPEDVLLLYELTDRNFHLEKPCFKEALQFAMEENPKWAYCYNGNQLPFGCHAWCHKDYYPFWSTFIKY